MIQAITKNLNKGIQLLHTISEVEYTNNSVAPYFSSIGNHIRHIMDVYDCIFEGLEVNKIDLTARKRNALAEQKIPVGIAYIQNTIDKVSQFAEEDLNREIVVSDNLGDKVVADATYTLGAILMQAHSHAIHHYASIGYIIYQLGIELPDDSFGFNPTTPKKEMAK